MNKEAPSDSPGGGEFEKTDKMMSRRNKYSLDTKSPLRGDLEGLPESSNTKPGIALSHRGGRLSHCGGESPHRHSALPPGEALQYK